MDQDKFAAIMPIICADLADFIARQEGIAEEEAVSKLYASKLYALLEQEDTKLWHYSTPMLYEMLRQGEETGEITFPDV